ncbi:MAG: site-specific integrase [Butyrivibrio sp.]|nr:site-specific integrase [Butyrivibrio sp.]
MGKDLRGRELGEGITQRKDGKYSARFTNRNGKRIGKYFDSVAEAQKWITLTRLDDESGSDTAVEYRMTVDEWFKYWMKNFKKDLSPNTIRNYRERYYNNIQQYIGGMLLPDVKAMHCQQILNDMQTHYSISTVYQAYICIGAMFKSALLNDLITKHPLDAVNFKAKKVRKPIRVLTIDEQRLFVQYADKNHNAKQFRLLLQTGLRTGELIGLTWNNFSIRDRTLTIDKSMEYRHDDGYWRAGPPKTLAGYRTIPLTDEAFDILYELYQKKGTRKEFMTLAQVLTFTDPRTGLIREVPMRNLIFVNFRTGEPIKNSTYDTNLYKICDKAGIKPFCMHALRHTFATRCIERGVNPKSLQKILGHAQLSTTMDTYIHVTDDSLQLAMRTFESAV